MKAIKRSLIFSILIGVCMYLIEASYHRKEVQKTIKELEQSEFAPVIQYFPETFKFYLITEYLWLDLFIFVGVSFIVFLFANLLFNKNNNSQGVSFIVFLFANLLFNKNNNSQSLLH
ncbi:hypothetical protein [Paenibacillus sp. Soil522]|uniref:hypothetical protein n=1 Tax=Paenibacillus sp. Soil522 TaxID=1736388 RepID=UPI0006FD2FB1|nr:hypothetical protein [Paenibacillus sp. Soil522]KRE48081.1 hypothetical protein ASG81_07070 [Paenibacillus sp. Soil522]